MNSHYRNATGDQYLDKSGISLMLSCTCIDRDMIVIQHVWNEKSSVQK